MSNLLEWDNDLDDVADYKGEVITKTIKDEVKTISAPIETTEQYKTENFETIVMKIGEKHFNIVQPKYD